MSFDINSNHFLYFIRKGLLYRFLLGFVFIILSEALSAGHFHNQNQVSLSHKVFVVSDLSLLNQITCMSYNVFREDSPAYHVIAGVKLLKIFKVDFTVYLVLLLILLIALFLLRRYEMNRLKIKNQLEIERAELESLRRLIALRSQFFTNLSHEFRIPLTLICGNIENLLSTQTSDAERERLESVRRNAGQLLTLVNQLLDLSKFEAGKMQLQFSRFNLISFADSIFHCFLSQAEPKGIKMIFEAGKDFIPVEMDRDKMGKMLNNLLSNALKYTDDGGVVRLLVNSLDHQIVEIRVEDNGQGIADEELTAIFNRFYQSGNTPGQNVEGTGIGLAHTRELAVLHNGSINAFSKKGEYTAFVIRLPVITAEPIDETTFDNALFSIEFPDSELPFRAVSSLDAVGSAESEDEKLQEIILVVEDNSEVRRFICKQLKDNYRTFEAEDGTSGFEIALQVIPDLIISDVMMPGIDGYQFSSEIRNNQLTSHIPLILLTAKSEVDDRLEGFENGIDDFITKPFSTRELRARIRNLLNIRKLLRERFERNGFAIPSDALSIPADKAFLEKAIWIIEEHIEDSGYKVESLAGALSISVSQLNRKLNALINVPAGELIRSYKLNRAAEMLKNKSGTVSEICYNLGFNDHAYFTRSFRKHFGCTPSEFMKAANTDKLN
ncbi:MAG: response regulator [Lentimicrobium sp.]|nr:response regulator [Lentimicrobium sp.]